MNQSGSGPSRMHDMIAPLLMLPASRDIVEKLTNKGVVVRRAQTMEMDRVSRFVDELWPNWCEGVRTGFASAPVRVFVATEGEMILGFAAYDIDYRGFFGPTGVDPARQGEGIGAALLLRCLEAMREAGYLYAIIGAVGPAEFYTHVCGAMPLPVDWPNYTDPGLS